ncbi:MAG: hypothetical protein ACFB8W_19745 [Elainellaceae cyanobacterium]
MRRQWRWLWGLAVAVAIAITINAPIPQGQLSSSQLGPSAVQAQTSPTTEALPLAETPYRDPENRFAVGIIEGFQVNTIANAPVIEAADGSLAYTVVVRPSLADMPLSNAALAQAARETFQQGEGFRIQGFQALPSGELRMTWTGQLTTSGPSQPLSGVILAQQQENQIFLTLIAATEAARSEIPGAIATITSSLEFSPE